VRGRDFTVADGVPVTIVSQATAARRQLLGLLAALVLRIAAVAIYRVLAHFGDAALDPIVALRQD
jgi:hypothetical protein